MPLERPGTALANPHIHSDPGSAKLHIRVSYLLSSDNLLCILMTTLRVHYHSVIYNGNRTKWSPIWSVIIQVINKIGQPQSTESNLLITSMITGRIGRHEVLLPINPNHYNFQKTYTFRTNISDFFF